MFKIANHYFPKSISLLLILETIVLLMSVYIGAKIRFYDSLNVADQYVQFIAPATIVTAAMLFSMSAFGLYQSPPHAQLRQFFSRLAPVYAMGFCIISVVFYVVPDYQIGRGILGIIFALSCIGLMLTRYVFFKSAQTTLFKSRVLFLGAGALARDCAELAQSRATLAKYDVAGYVQIGTEERAVPVDCVLPKKRSLYETARYYNASEVVVAVRNKRDVSLPIQELLECKLRGIRVIDSAVFFEREACQIRVHSFQPSWLVFGGGFDQNFSKAFFKRAFDLVVSVALATVTLPIMLLAALLVFLEDRGPIFYTQERVGRGGHHYNILKFRSMSINAEQSGQPQWALKNDPRVTRVGAVIRQLRIDELPQIFCVLKGDMSFVGPRPERPYFVSDLCQKIPYYDVRHSIKPGITGMAQVRYAYGASVEDAVQKLQYDLYYVKNNSLFLDLLILIDTIQVVLLGKGAR